MRYGRWPKHPSKYHASFKAEENQKFVQWCLPMVLANVTNLSMPSMNLGMLLVDIAHIFYNFSRTNGWTMESINAARSLFLAWRIRSEEYYGANSSPLEHVAGVRLLVFSALALKNKK